MKVLRRYILLVVFLTQSNAELIRPVDGQRLHYVHVVFEWEQQPEALSYQLELHDINANVFFTYDLNSAHYSNAYYAGLKQFFNEAVKSQSQSLIVFEKI